MRPDVTSKHLRTSTELTLIAPIKQGFIEYVDTVTYASRLRTLLGMFFELRKAADERSGGSGGKELDYVGPLEQLQTLHFVQWAILDDDTRLMLNVTFDRSWESYVRDIVDIAGPLLDIILCHCEGYEESATDLGYEKFAAWVRRYQVKNDFFYAAEPSLTSDDHRYHVALLETPAMLFEERNAPGGGPIGAELEDRLAKLRVTIRKQSGGMHNDPAEIVRTLIDLKRIGGALFDVRRYFSSITADGAASYLSASARRDLKFYDEIAFLMLAGFELETLGTKIDALEIPKDPLLAWCLVLPSRMRKHPRADNAIKERIPAGEISQIQRGLLTPFDKATHGCVVLLAWPSPASGARLLKQVQRAISFEAPEHGDASDSDADGTSVSLALTFSGLKALDLTEHELRAFPKEFREGMEARSGILGDIKASHPSTWNLPKANCDEDCEPLKGESETVALASVHAVLLLQTNASFDARDYRWSSEHPLRGKLRALIKDTGARVQHVQPLLREYKGDAMIEHFGFRDDISQPHVAYEGGEERPVLARDRVAPGEIVLGYPNARGEVVRFIVDGVPAPAKLDLLRNSSFFVLRKLKQDVKGFQKFLDEGAAALGSGMTADGLAALMMGRDRSVAGDGKTLDDYKGKPLGKEQTIGADQDRLARLSGREKATMQAQVELNSFDFSDGRCPFHAHIRRVNPRDEAPQPQHGADSAKPRDSNTPQRRTPRILRRSFPYGPLREKSEHPVGDDERGLMFMAFNAGIADQFEILQRWLSGGNSTGLPSSLADLISGASNAAVFPVSIGNQVRWLKAPEKPLVELQWGMYTFVPSRRALALLAESASEGGRRAVDATRSKLLARGVEVIDALHALPEAEAEVAWKRVLENRDSAEDTRAVWAAVLAVHGGALKTPYGVLVAGEHNVYEVLRDCRTYSVREYWHRMTDSIGAMHLGMDPDPQAMPQEHATAKDRAYEAAVNGETYASIAKELNPKIAAITELESFEDARDATVKLLDGLPAHPQSGLSMCDLRDVAGLVMQTVAAKKLGLPAPQALPPSTMSEFRQCSVYVFSVKPEPWVREGAREAGERLCQSYRAGNYAAIGGHADWPRDPVVAKAPVEAGLDADKEALAASLKGAAFGFLAATAGSVLNTLFQWLESGELWKVQQSLPTLREPKPDEKSIARDRDALTKMILAAMQRAPAPAVLHRQVVRPTRLGPVSLVPGDRVVVGLGTVPVTAPKDVDVMFGGDYTAAERPVHACPGRDMAIGVMTGFVWTLLRQEDIRRVSELNALKVTFRRRAAPAGSGSQPLPTSR